MLEGWWALGKQCGEMVALAPALVRVMPLSARLLNTILVTCPPANAVIRDSTPRCLPKSFLSHDEPWLRQSRVDFFFVRALPYGSHVRLERIT